jgi:hypothetical protein
MKARMQTILWGVLTVILIGCNSVEAADLLIPTQKDVVELDLQDATATPILTPKDVVEPDLPDINATPNPAETPIETPMISNPNLHNLVDQAKADLADRLSIPVTEIDLLEARHVVWPDGSLGCPKPGVQYIQVLTPGYLVLLKANGVQFEYHAGESNIFYCKNPKSPVPRTPLDQ